MLHKQRDTRIIGIKSHNIIANVAMTVLTILNTSVGIAFSTLQTATISFSDLSGTATFTGYINQVSTIEIEMATIDTRKLQRITALEVQYCLKVMCE